MESKPYLVIARKYRPRTFDEVVGQDHVATTLKNAITLNRVGHAYLFTGPRGVGKTSMARIFAKALNCKDGPTLTPCGKCQACADIETARSLDVLEIDGASNRGIDEIRALRENAKFSPALGKFKIYIIDEVHQITNDGFNALLKTLEEPPAHVKFVFATTASHKVPATILSRCQRFDFRAIPSERIASTLKEICKKEKIKIEDEALFAIAKAADGSLRDSQSILDQIASSSGEKIAKDDVTRSLGSLDEETLFKVTDAIAGRDAKTALLTLDAVLKEGKDPALFLERLLEHVRNLLFLQVADSLADLVDASESYKKELARQKPLFSRDELFYFFAVVSNALVAMKRFEVKRLPLEIALVKLSSRAPMEDLSRAAAALKEALASAKLRPVPAPAAPAPALARETPRAAAPMPAAPPVPIAPKTEEPDSAADDEELLGDVELTPVVAAPPEAAEPPVSLQPVWPSLVAAVKKDKMSVGTYLAEGAPGPVAGNVARILFPEALTFHRETLETPENKRLIERHLATLLGSETRVEFHSVKAVAVPKPEDAPPPAAVKSAMNIFGGRVIK